MPVAISPAKIEAYRHGNCGIPFAVRLDSGMGGPEVLVTAVIHGNEISGAIAVDDFLRSGRRPIKGAITFCFANVEAYFRFSKQLPNLSRYVDEDMNRVWSPHRLDGPEQATTIELRRAREIRPLVDRADHLLDLHSMSSDGPPMVLCGPLEKGKLYAKRIGLPHAVIIDSGHGDGIRMRDYGRFADKEDSAGSLLVECGQHWKKDTVGIAKSTLERFLVSLGVIDETGSLATGVLPTFNKAPDFYEVTDTVVARTHQFTFTQTFSSLDRIDKAGTVLALDGGHKVVTPYDDAYLVMPTAGAAPGQTAVRIARKIDVL